MPGVYVQFAQRSVEIAHGIEGMLLNDVPWVSFSFPLQVFLHRLSAQPAGQ